MVRMVLDCTEYREHASSIRKDARTVWSDYKQGHTIKSMAAILPTCVHVWSFVAYLGGISNIDICEHGGFLDLAEEGDCCLPTRAIFIS